jgi:hypothetical protein
MGKRDLVLITVAGICLSSLSLAADDPNQYDYTVPAREKLTTGTLSGLAEAYQILDEGLADPNVTGDRRELLFFHALARTGMLVLDMNDVAVNTSIVELLEPYGITASGDKLFVPDPCDPNEWDFMPSDPCDPDAFRLNFPIDPCDPNCYLVPSGLDESTLDETADVVNNVIAPEISSIIAELDLITDSSEDRFRTYLEPNETGLTTRVEVDYAEVLALKGLLAGARASLRGMANPAYDLLINPYASPFSGRVCDTSYGINSVLGQYPSLLRVLPTPDGAASLAQARLDVIAGIDAYFAVLNHISSETDPQEDDLISVDPNADDVVDLYSQRLSALKQSLQEDSVVTYPWLITKTYDLIHGGTSIAQLTITYDITGYDIAAGRLDGLLYPADASLSPRVCSVDWGEKYNNRIEIDFEHQSMNSWFWGSLEGTLSNDDQTISSASLSVSGQWDGVWVSNSYGVSGKLVSQQVTSARLDLNPIYGGTSRYPNPVSPRDVLPQYDTHNDPVPGTFGHGLGNDATLGGILPDMTQEDWIAQGYEVWGIDPNEWIPSQPGSGDEPDLTGSSLLGASDGQTKSFDGSHPYYLIATVGQVRVDSIQTSDGQYYTGDIVAFNASHNGENIEGAPDGNFDTVGNYEILSTVLPPKQYTGGVLITNLGAWTGLTVITDANEACLPYDWNDDGIASIVGDVPPFVDCVYFGDCPVWLQEKLLCVGDCNGDGILSIVGDVPCFVDCVYFGDCP